MINHEAILLSGELGGENLASHQPSLPPAQRSFKPGDKPLKAGPPCTVLQVVHCSSVPRLRGCHPHCSVFKLTWEALGVCEDLELTTKSWDSSTHGCAQGHWHAQMRETVSSQPYSRHPMVVFLFLSYCFQWLNSYPYPACKPGRGKA